MPRVHPSLPVIYEGRKYIITRIRLYVENCHSCLLTLLRLNILEKIRKFLDRGVIKRQHRFYPEKTFAFERSP